MCLAGGMRSLKATPVARYFHSGTLARSLPLSLSLCLPLPSLSLLPHLSCSLNHVMRGWLVVHCKFHLCQASHFPAATGGKTSAGGSEATRRVERGSRWTIRGRVFERRRGGRPLGMWIFLHCTQTETKWSITDQMWAWRQSGEERQQAFCDHVKDSHQSGLLSNGTCWTTVEVVIFFHPHLEQMYSALYGPFDSVNNELSSTLRINPPGLWRQRAPVSMSRVITGHNYRGHIALVSGHLTICTQICTRTHIGTFFTQPGLIFILTSTNWSVLSSPLKHTGGFHKALSPL